MRNTGLGDNRVKEIASLYSYHPRNLRISAKVTELQTLKAWTSSALKSHFQLSNWPERYFSRSTWVQIPVLTTHLAVYIEQVTSPL
jgi:hypothetical protein